MRDTILKLWHGEINPEAMCFARDSEYGEVQRQAVEAEKILLYTLTQEQEQQLNEYASLIAKRDGMENAESFVMGFRLGVKLMTEGLSEVDGDLKGIPD